MATWLNGGDWGTRENAIPGEWALLVLCMVAAALIGVAVFWFTTLRHERAVLNRARRRADRHAGGAGRADGPGGAGRADGPGGAGGSGRKPEQRTTQSFDSAPDAKETEAEPSRVHASHFASESAPGLPEPGLEAKLEPEPQLEARPEPEPQPASSPATASPTQRKPPRHKLTQEMLDLVAHERARRKSVKWKELAALVEREFGVQVHPRTIERSLRRRKAPTEAAAASDSGSA